MNIRLTLKYSEYKSANSSNDDILSKCQFPTPCNHSNGQEKVNLLKVQTLANFEGERELKFKRNDPLWNLATYLLGKSQDKVRALSRLAINF